MGSLRLHSTGFVAIELEDTLGAPLHVPGHGFAGVGSDEPVARLPRFPRGIVRPALLHGRSAMDSLPLLEAASIDPNYGHLYAAMADWARAHPRASWHVRELSPAEQRAS